MREEKLKTVGLPNRHDYSTRRQSFYVCNNCRHWQVFVWYDAITNEPSPKTCWTCGSQDVSHSSQRPRHTMNETPKGKLRKLGVKKLTELLAAKGIRV